MIEAEILERLFIAGVFLGTKMHACDMSICRGHGVVRVVFFYSSVGYHFL
jgi:hypothetical protein